MVDPIDPEVSDSASGEPERKLRPANENPWYLLATLHGEQPEVAGLRGFDIELHAKNRLSWNRFIAGQATNAELAWFRSLKNDDGSPRFSEDELKPYGDAEWLKLHARFKRRGGSDLPAGDIDFSNTAFVEGLFLRGFAISGPAGFRMAAFSGTADFQSVAFSNTADFHNATFSSVTNFESAAFLNYTDFKSATFSSYTDFESAAFSSYTDFEGATFSSYTRFKSAVFSNYAEFNNAEFKNTTIFARTTFRKRPPKFFGAKLHEDTDWAGITWPPPPDAESSGDHLRAYERLKQEMERLKKHEDEHNFLCLEMACKEVRDGFPKNLPSRLYRIFSDYGRSIARPLAWLLIVIGVSFSLLMWTQECPLVEGKYCAPGTETHMLPIGKALGLAVTSVVGVLPIKKEVFGEIGHAYSSWAHLIMGIEAVFGALLLFLLGLALRNRFRMK